METKREWILAWMEGNKDLPIPQHWMSFFNGETAKKLTPEECHYPRIWVYDVPEQYDMSAMGPEALDALIRMNNYSGRCFSCLGPGANQAFGHGGPGEFFARTLEKHDNGMILEYESGAKAQVQYEPHFYHNYDQPIKSMEDAKALELPDPNDPARYEGFAKDVAYLKEKGEYVVGSLNGFFSGIHYYLMDYEQTLMSILIEPELIEECLNKIGNWNLTVAKKIIDAGADCIALCDDLGSQQQMLMPPEQYRQMFKPWHKRLCETVHAGGGHVHLHSHGAITPILDDLVECGFDFINPFDMNEGFDIEQLLKDYSDKFIVTGGVPAKFWNWEAEEQHRHLEWLAEVSKKYGRIVWMDGSGVPESVTKEDFDRINKKSRELRGVEGSPFAV